MTTTKQINGWTIPVLEEKGAFWAPETESRHHRLVVDLEAKLVTTFSRVGAGSPYSVWRGRAVEIAVPDNAHGPDVQSVLEASILELDTVANEHGDRASEAIRAVKGKIEQCRTELTVEVFLGWYAHDGDRFETDLAQTIADGDSVGAAVKELVDEVDGDVVVPVQLLTDQAQKLLEDRLEDVNADIYDELLDLQARLLDPDEDPDDVREEIAEVTAERNMLWRALDKLAARRYAVRRDDGPALAFTGWLVASVSSKRGKATRWTELRLYRTDAGAWVCHEVGRSEEEGEVDRHRAAVVDTEADVVTFFGTGRLGTGLLKEAGIPVVEEV